MLTVAEAQWQGQTAHDMEIHMEASAGLLGGGAGWPAWGQWLSEQWVSHCLTPGGIMHTAFYMNSMPLGLLSLAVLS